MESEEVDKETLEILQKHQLTIETLQYITHEKLEAIGIKSWGKRMAVLTAAKHFYEYYSIMAIQQQQFKQNILLQRIFYLTYQHYSFSYYISFLLSKPIFFFFLIAILNKIECFVNAYSPFPSPSHYFTAKRFKEDSHAQQQQQSQQQQQKQQQQQQSQRTQQQSQQLQQPQRLQQTSQTNQREQEQLQQLLRQQLQRLQQQMNSQQQQQKAQSQEHTDAKQAPDAETAQPQSQKGQQQQQQQSTTAASSTQKTTTTTTKTEGSTQTEQLSMLQNIVRENPEQIIQLLKLMMEPGSDEATTKTGNSGVKPN